MEQAIKSVATGTITSLRGGQPFNNWIDREGPNGGRNVIDRFDVYAIGEMDVAGAVLPGEDLARIAQNIRVRQKDGVHRWSLPGDASRIATYAFLGADKVTEHADIAIAVNQAVAYCWQIPMLKPWMHTPEDFALPVEEFKDLIIDLNPAATIQTGASVITNAEFVFYVIAHVREEHDVRLHCVDEVKMETFKSLTQGTFVTSGLVQDFIFHADGAEGGASLANLIDARIDGYREPLLRTPDLLNTYRNLRNAGNNLSTTQAAELRNDPFLLGAAPKAAALFLHGKETSAWGGKMWSKEMKVDATNTVASLRGIYREVTPLTMAARNRALAYHGLTPADLRVATDAKSSRNPADWPPALRPFLPMKGNKAKKAA